MGTMGTENPNVPIDVAKSSLGAVTVDKTPMPINAAMLKTVMEAEMLEEITARITNKTMSTIELLEAFVKESKTRLFDLEFLLARYFLRNLGSDTAITKEESSRTVLIKFFDKADAQRPFSLCMIKNPSAGGQGLAKDVSQHMSNDKKITDFDTLEILLETLMEAEVHREAFSWTPPTGKEQEALMQYITGDCARFWMGKSGGVKLAPGFWLMLKIRQELCAHILSSDNF